MGTMSIYFFDTYAIVELIKGNPHYFAYADAIIITAQFNMVEFYNSLLVDHSVAVARAVYLKYKECVKPIDNETIFDAVELRRKHKKRNISYVDCIGYAYAKRHNMKFLTGDKEFENLPNVEFVK